MVSPLIVSLKKLRSFCDREIKLLSPAKLNLYLNLTGKIGDFHRIESIVERVSLFDEVKIKLRKDREIRVYSTCKKIEGENNICFKAAKLMRSKFDLAWGMDIFIKKNIPLGSGLGGGSSNAAVTLIGINKLLDLNLTKKILYQLGSQLGSDVNFFLSDSSFAFVYHRGEKVLPLAGAKFHHLIIWPKISLSTPQIYRKARGKLTKFLSNVKILKYAIKKPDLFLLRKNTFNVLERSAFSFCPELKRIKRNLEKKDLSVRMTGSGGAFYTIEKDSYTQIKKERLVKKEEVFKVQTF